MKTVHLIFNTHLDPVYLWPWQAALDEILATCRIACDMLDRNPDLIYNRGEAWLYQIVERLEPDLFQRIRQHVATGRWEIVGGWWLQPDCNLPSGSAFEKQISLGRDYFTSKFGRFPKTAWNVDSFGHAATLPTYMAAAGQKHYVMMRPQEHEKALPARLFRWRERPGSAEISVFRIAGCYSCDKLKWEHIDQSLTELPPGVNDTMCLVSAGDHGGGPTEKQIAWIRENQASRPGIKLVISSPSRFFKKIASQIPSLPLVTGELQPHAIGCYSVNREIKGGVRRAENLLQQAEIVRQQLGQRVAVLPSLDRAWEQICFSHFHDILGGTGVPSANVQIVNQIGEAAALADENLHLGFRLLVSDLPGNPCQQMVVYNPSAHDFDGYYEAEPWLEGLAWENIRVLDENGKTVAEQVMHSEANHGPSFPRIVFRVRIPAGGKRVYRLLRDPRQPTPQDASLSKKIIHNRLGLEVRPGAHPRLAFPIGILTPELHLIEDPTDTWSHGIDRYANRIAARPVWDPPVFPDTGPLMASCVQNGTLSSSRVQSEYRVYAGSPWISLRLRVHWQESHKILKLVLKHPDLGPTRLDGIMGGTLERENSGAEHPLRDWSLFSLGKIGKLAVVAPDVFGVDATPKRVRFTLLRSAWLATHIPNPDTSARSLLSDGGTHEFHFQFALGKNLRPSDLEQQARQLQQPPLYADVTKGMLARPWAGN